LQFGNAEQAAIESASSAATAAAVCNSLRVLRPHFPMKRRRNLNSKDHLALTNITPDEGKTFNVAELQQSQAA
jgi:hypothetical protein